MKNIRIVVILILIASVSFWAGGHFGNKRPAGSGTEGARKVLYYTDPMNPGFRSEKPGIAPCGMPLEPVYADAGEAGGSATPVPAGAVTVSPFRRQIIGVKVATVENTPMTYTLRLYGKIVPDETRVYRVNASTDSWIREISDVTTGSIVNKDQILAEALAPAYYNAQVTYLVALNNLDRIKEQLGGELRHQQGELADNQVRLAVQALQNLGITDAQVEELANTRKARPYLQVRAPTRGVVLKRNISLNQWFKAAEEFYTISDIRRVWVYAYVYENEARYLKPGMRVLIKHAQLGKTFDAAVSEVLPLFDPLSKTLKVRLDVDNPRYDLRPDMFVDVEIPITMPPSLNVPADAVIDSGVKTVVYVEKGGGVFVPRRVETGWRLGRRVEIIGGLMSGEHVVVSGNFLLDSESLMKTAAAGLEIKTSRDPVCGMEVDEEEAHDSGRTAILAGKTYYFCSDECKQIFEKAAPNLAKTITPVLPEPARTAMPGKDGVRAGMPDPPTAWQGRGTEPAGRSPDRAEKHRSSRGVVDWDGPEPENGAPRDWKGWGKFPGAKYLGLEEKTPNTVQQQKTTGDGGGKASATAQGASSPEHHPGTNNDMPDGPAPDNREGPTNP